MSPIPPWRPIFLVLAAALTAPAMAQPADPVADAAAMKALEATVPPQSWYPEGYYDVRIAAESEQREVEVGTKDLLVDWGDGEGKRYNIDDCGAESPPVLEVDPVTARYGFVASEVARIRGDLERLKFPAALYAEPLLAFEKAKIEAADAAMEEAERLTQDPVAIPEGEVSGDGNSTERDASTAFISAIEANRRRLAPKLAKLVAGGCPRYDPSGGAKIIVKTAPPAGAVWLVNAFAFKVCARQKPDPWDRMACKWNEIETGVERRLSGRYVYQIRWPDGTVRKGTREVVPDYESETAVTVTFKKTGS